MPGGPWPASLERQYRWKKNRLSAYRNDDTSLPIVDCRLIDLRNFNGNPPFSQLLRWSQGLPGTRFGLSALPITAPAAKLFRARHVHWKPRSQSDIKHDLPGTDSAPGLVAVVGTSLPGCAPSAKDKFRLLNTRPVPRCHALQAEYDCPTGWATCDILRFARGIYLDILTQPSRSCNSQVPFLMVRACPELNGVNRPATHSSLPQPSNRLSEG